MLAGVKSMRRFLLASTVAGIACLAGLSAMAAPITLGLAAEPSSLDPQFSRTGNNQMVAMHMFDRLVTTDRNNQLKPGLAESWRVVDPLTWEIKLRQGVRFHDGAPLTVEDVVYSLERVKTVANSPAPFTQNVGAIQKIEVVDPQTIRFVTKRPTPQFMEQAGLVYILRKAVAESAKPEDYNSGKAVIGTGPYKFADYAQGQRVVMTRNDDYWGEKPAFEKATLRFVTDDGARVVALLSGELDVIDQVPPALLERIKGDARYAIHSTASTRLVYFAVDSAREQSPQVTGSDGKPLAKNPLQDQRVRLALSKLINRKAIVDRILVGSGEAAGQMVPSGLGGHAPDLKPTDYDPEGAKKLLAEAGYADGFGLTIHSSNDRVPRDSEVAQAVGQMFQRGGIKVNGVVTQPYTNYVTAAGKQEFSFFLFSYGTTTSNAAVGLTNVLATYDREKGMGAFNRARYSNKAFDAALAKALEEFDESKRNEALQEAGRIAFKDTAVVPLYWQVVHWASKKGIAYRPSRNEDTLAMHAAPAQ